MASKAIEDGWLLRDDASDLRAAVAVLDRRLGSKKSIWFQIICKVLTKFAERLDEDADRMFDA